jgi:hypothetical protein
VIYNFISGRVRTFYHRLHILEFWLSLGDCCVEHNVNHFFIFVRISTYVDFLNGSGMTFSVISCEKWERMMVANGWNSVELRDNRYNQIIHMVSAANGAEDFYTTEVCIVDRNMDYMRQWSIIA